MSGGSDDAANEANRAEANRQAKISETQARVNEVFASPTRAAEIEDTTGAVRDYYTTDLNKQKSNSDRNLKFALARGGLTGGSAQVDQQRVLGDEYAQGVLDVERLALGAGTELSAADQAAQQQLISLATTGLDATTAASQSAAAMQTNLEASKNNALAQGLGDVFGQTKSFADQARDASERRRANRDAGWSIYTPVSYGGQP